MLPTVATDGARLVRVMLSLTLPSPLIFTVKGLPAKTEQALESSPEATRGIYRKPKHGTGRADGATHTRHVLIGEFGGDDVNARHGGEVGDLASAVLQVLCLDVHFAGAFHGQGDAAITCNTVARGCYDSSSSGRGSLMNAERTSTPGNAPESRKTVTVAPVGQRWAQESVKRSEKSWSEISWLKVALTTLSSQGYPLISHRPSVLQNPLRGTL